jgi:hypothetical protein
MVADFPRSSGDNSNDRFAPAESLQTLGPSRKLMRVELERGLPHLDKGWDREFESPLLQQAVCLSGERRDCTGKALHFGGILREAGT